MTCFPPLFADVGDLIMIVIAIVIFLISAAGKLLAKQRKPQQPGVPRRPPVAPPAGAGPQDEIADFLRRAIQRQGGGQRPQPPPAMAEVIHTEVIEPEVVQSRLVGGGVSRHVGEHLDTAEFRHRAAQLGDEVAHADDQMGDRLHQKFDHEVSRLAGTPGESAEAPEDRIDEMPAPFPGQYAAAGLPVLLSNAQNIRQAIVISEILNRPEHRWS